MKYKQLRLIDLKIYERDYRDTAARDGIPMLTKQADDPRKFVYIFIEKEELIWKLISNLGHDHEDLMDGVIVLADVEEPR